MNQRQFDMTALIRTYVYVQVKKIRWQAEPQGRLLSGIAANEARAIH
ncbi:hypothetical protein Q1M64_30405 [Sinorhizobium meliloti]|nr:hypothetical protein Q1M64_30405 [Sinorhizobium meliloti]